MVYSKASVTHIPVDTLLSLLREALGDKSQGEVLQKPYSLYYKDMRNRKENLEFSIKTMYYLIFPSLGISSITLDTKYMSIGNRKREQISLPISNYKIYKHSY